MARVQTIQYDLLIDGEWRPAQSGEYFEVENPATGKSIARMANAGPEDVADAVASAERAFLHGPWSDMDGGERGRILWRIADLIEGRMDELGRLASIANGRLIYETASTMKVVASYFRDLAGF